MDPHSVKEVLGACQPVSSFSHLIAAAVALAAGVPLMRQSRTRPHALAIAVFVASVVVTLTVSGIYHRQPLACHARMVLQRMDYYAIWLLIAGTFTAVHGVMFRGFWRSGVLAFIWSYAAVGVILQTIRFHLFSGPLGLVLYLGMGWIGAVSMLKIGRQVGFRAARPILCAGVVYSLGAILEATGRPTLIDGWVGPHEVFHFAVILGVALHWSFIRGALIHYVPREPAPPAAAVPSAAA